MCQTQQSLIQILDPLLSRKQWRPLPVLFYLVAEEFEERRAGEGLEAGGEVVVLDLLSHCEVGDRAEGEVFGALGIVCVAVADHVSAAAESVADAGGDAAWHCI